MYSPPQGGGRGYGGRSLRSVLSFLTGGGVMLVAGVLALETVAKDEFKPSHLLGAFEASRELSEINGKMGDSPNRKVRMTEAQYQSAIAEAQRAGAAKADLEFQKKVAIVQTDVERVKGAYATLYERTNELAKYAAGMEASLQQGRQQVILQSQATKQAAVNVHEVGCQFGSATECETARRLREEMIQELNELATNADGARVATFMQNLADPASIVVRTDILRNGAPALDRQPAAENALNAAS